MICQQCQSNLSCLVYQLSSIDERIRQKIENLKKCDKHKKQD
ncbi:MAG: hypothetical protein AB4041_21300 [Microcystaceae cyanobacterium]